MKNSSCLYKPMLLSATLVVVTACTQARFEAIPLTEKSSGTTEPPEMHLPTPPPAVVWSTETFVQDSAGNQVDILIVNDNSLSMYEEQTKLGERFASFIAGIADVDYHIGMTTTDIESPRFNQDGRLLTWDGTGSTVLTPATLNKELAFEDTVKRKETLECDGTILNCPASNERPLDAIMRAFEQKDGANAGMFRARAPLVLVLLSDEDQESDAPMGSTSSETLLTKYTQLFPEKRLMSFGIVIKPGDLVCQDQQRAQEGGSGKGYFGTAATRLAELTGGDTVSICERDYATPLAEMSRKMRRLVNSFELRRAPKGEVVVTLSPSAGIGYKVQGNRVIFDAPPAVGTRITVSYE